MASFVEIMDAEQLAQVVDIPSWMPKGLVKVTIVSLPEEDEEAVESEKPKVNKAIAQKFQAAAEAGEFKEHLKKKLAEGFQFPFDAEKVINGTETDVERQARFRMEKMA
jgi:hypothetical protein